MCKYCENGMHFAIQPCAHGDLGVRALIHKSSIMFMANKNIASGYCDIDFCPKCGTPLGEVKPLTVEQLKEREGKPVWCKEFRMWALVYIHENWEPHLILSDGSPLINHPANRYTLFDRKPKGEAE